VITSVYDGPTASTPAAAPQLQRSHGIGRDHRRQALITDS
jgi:hypothetical protein